MAKKKLVTKVSDETGVEVSDLERLPVDALTKLDALVPDEDDLLSGNNAEVEVKEPEAEGKTFLGYRPITNEEVWI